MVQHLPYYADLDLSEIVYKIEIYGQRDDIWNFHLQGLYDKKHTPIVETKRKFIYYQNTSKSDSISRPNFMEIMLENSFMKIKVDSTLPSASKVYLSGVKDRRNYKSKVESIIDNPDDTIRNLGHLIANASEFEKAVAFSALSELNKKHLFTLMDRLQKIFPQIEDNDVVKTYIFISEVAGRALRNNVNHPFFSELINSNTFINHPSSLVQFFAARYIEEYAARQGKSVEQIVEPAIAENVAYMLNQQYINNQINTFFGSLVALVIEHLVDRTWVLLETRTGPKWAEEVEDEKPKNIGPHGEHLMNFLLYQYNKRESAPARKCVNKWLRAFGGGDLHVSPDKFSTSPAQGDELDGVFGTVDDATYDVSLNLSSMGYGFKQILNVCVAGFFSPPGSTIVIDEPELHLHPENQMKLMDMLIDIMHEDKQIVVVTHSENLFLRLQKRIAQTNIDPNTDYPLSPEEVAVYYLERGEEGTEAEEIAIEKDGRIPGWLPGVTDSFEQEMAEIVEMQARAESEDDD